MYHKIVVPVALTHTETLDKAMKVVADLSKHYGASVHVVGITAPTPDPVSHNAEEYANKLGQFAAEQSSALGAEFEPHPIVTNDPVTELEPRLDEYIHEIGADLVVMATHIPGFREYVFASNAGFLASHTDVSVFLVR